MFSIVLCIVHECYKDTILNKINIIIIIIIITTMVIITIIITTLIIITIVIITISLIIGDKSTKAASTYFHLFRRPSSASLSNNTLQNGL